MSPALTALFGAGMCDPVPVIDVGGGRMRRSIVVLVAAVLVVASGCGGDDSGSDSGDGGGSPSGVVSAVLGIITTNIETDTGDGFSEAVEGEELVVGDQVKTDSTGFAEVTYHEGSWMRVESEATLTIEDLSDADDGQVVSTSIDTGEAWNRVRELSEPEDSYELETPVATAAVRGTAFSVSCEGANSCTFSVVEGEVEVSPVTGDSVTLTAGQTLTVTAGEAPAAPTEPGVEALSSEPFIATNLELDETKAAEPDDGDTSDGGGTEGSEEGNGADDGTDGEAAPASDLSGALNITAPGDDTAFAEKAVAFSDDHPDVSISVQGLGGEGIQLVCGGAADVAFSNETPSNLICQPQTERVAGLTAHYLEETELLREFLNYLAE